MSTTTGLVEEYRRAACVVLPSVYTTPDGRTTLVPELLGQTLLEAMACGRPAICTDVASMPEVVVNGETGYVVPPGNPAALGAAIASVLADPDAADRMGARGRARVLEHFSWSKVVDRCLAAYRALIDATSKVWHLVTPEFPPLLGGVSEHSRVLAAAAAGRGRDGARLDHAGRAAGCRRRTCTPRSAPSPLPISRGRMPRSTGMPLRAICSCNGCRTASATAA